LIRGLVPAEDWRVVAIGEHELVVLALILAVKVEVAVLDNKFPALVPLIPRFELDVLSAQHCTPLPASGTTIATAAVRAP
jgi:hypothetical protein